MSDNPAKPSKQRLRRIAQLLGIATPEDPQKKHVEHGVADSASTRHAAWVASHHGPKAHPPAAVRTRPAIRPKPSAGKKTPAGKVTPPQKPPASPKRAPVGANPSAAPKSVHPPAPRIHRADAPVIVVNSPAPAPAQAPAAESIPHTDPKFTRMDKAEVRDRLRQILGNFEIPRFRKAVFETLRRLRDPNTTPEKIVEVMSIDADLTSRVMKTVNSLAYSQKSRISSLDHAIMVMGNSDLERLVMMIGAKAALPGQVPPALNLQDFWRVSARRAVLAKGLADLVVPVHANLSFSAGFLQDLSVPLLISGRTKDYGPVLTDVLSQKKDLHTMERDAFGWDHADVSGLVCLDWELPDDLTLAIKDQNHPSSPLRPDPVHLVSSLKPSDGGEWDTSFGETVRSRYTVDDERFQTMLTESNKRANELIRLM